MSIIEVNCDNLENNPKCAHGPTLKFSRLVKGKIKIFYACSACRDRKDCPFFLWEGELITKSKLLAWKDWENKVVPLIDHDKLQERLICYKKLKHNRQFCISCFDFIFPSDEVKHLGHKIKDNVSNSTLCFPTKLLVPINKDKKEAQYWFSEKSKKFIVDHVKTISFDSVICLGTPTIHENLKQMDVNTLLMDIDYRYHWFYNSDEFCWFNMFNFYFMGNENVGRKAVQKALAFTKVVIIIDPPFGARLEPLKRTIQEFVNLIPNEIKIMLILPYFMEPEVLSSFPDFNMLDYKIEYANHSKFKNKPSNKSSPVRIFTNISPGEFVFPSNEGYYFCEICSSWRSELNTHCSFCKTCTSKNGEVYKHCFVCRKCVKGTWTHCIKCQKCLLADHVCSEKIKNKTFKRRKKVII